MRALLFVAAFSIACSAWCGADEATDGGHDDRASNQHEGGAASAFSPAQRAELERLLDSALARARANDGDTRNANIKLQVVVDDDDHKPRQPGDGHRREEARGDGDRHGDGQRPHDGPHGDARDEGRHEADHGPRQGPGPWPDGAGHFDPVGHPPHTIMLHIYVHHDSRGGPPPAVHHGVDHRPPREMHRSDGGAPRARHGADHGRPREMHHFDGPPPVRHWTHEGGPGEMHHPPRGHRDRRPRESDDHGEHGRERSADTMESLRDDVNCLHEELDDLSRHVRKLAKDRQ